MQRYEKILLDGIDESLNGSTAEELVCIRDRALRNGNYARAKDANACLAVLECREGEVSYKHLPVVMQFELTDSCDLRCIMCTHAYDNVACSGFLELECVERWLPCLKIAVINGVGEPMLHPGFVKLLEMLKQYGVKAFLTSNLQHADCDFDSAIAQTVSRLCVSCDGSDKATYEGVRRGGSFDVFCRNAARLARNCTETYFQLAVVAMRQNIMQAPELVKLACDLGFHEVRFGRLETNAFLKNEGDSLLRFPNLASLVFTKAADLGNDLGIKVIVPRIFQEAGDKQAAEEELAVLTAGQKFRPDSFYDDLRLEYQKKRSLFSSFEGETRYEGEIESSGLCHWLSFGCYLSVSGEMRPCAEIVGNYGVEYQIGESIGNPLNIMSSCKLRQSFVEAHVPHACINCSYLMSDELNSVQVNNATLAHKLVEAGF